MNRKMIRQAQQLQRQIAKLQEELESATVESSAGGGMVKAVVSGKLRVESLEIDPQVVSDDDVDMLQDLVAAAVNEGLEKAQEMAAA
jgi:DNA-binding YbaB/EbfC family protein